MKKLFLVIIILALTVGISSAATLRWDKPDGTIVGYTAYYSDGETVFNKSFTTEEESVPDIESFFNLAPGVTYTFNLVAYNDNGASNPSNSTEPFAAFKYTPPADIIPATVRAVPSQIQNPVLDI